MVRDGWFLSVSGLFLLPVVLLLKAVAATSSASLQPCSPSHHRVSDGVRCVITQHLPGLMSCHQYVSMVMSLLGEMAWWNHLKVGSYPRARPCAFTLAFLWVQLLV